MSKRSWTIRSMRLLAGVTATVTATLAVAAATPSAAVVVPAAVPFTPYFSTSPQGEAPCPEGESRSATLYTQGFESAIPESRFTSGFTRVAGTAPQGSSFARASHSSSATTSKFMFLPYVRGSEGTHTRLAFAYRNSAAAARGGAFVNSFGATLATTTSWRGQNLDITSATLDEGGWLGGWFQHNVTAGTSTYLDLDNIQYFTCRGNSTSRIAGANRYDTAAQLSERFAAGVPVAFVARGDLFPDSLSASALAGHLESPVLLTGSDALPATTTAALQRLQPREIVVLGDVGAVSAQVAAELTALAPAVRRLGGADRYATAALVSAEFEPGVPVALLATGTNYADAMTGAALGGARGGPMLLTGPDALPEPVAAELARLRPEQVVVLGSESVVSAAAAAEAATYAVGPEPKVVRLAGADRYATASAVAAQFGSAVTHTYLATGENFPDGLTAAALAGAEGVPLLITATGSLSEPTRSRLVEIQEQDGVVIGGDDVVSQLVRDQYGRTLP
ncbi:MAG TPA: cell wall-binding repeat-containing protein [Actinotalea sp.]|nr:cell wall-binding repeat-containing protein [Actinotalea sp.]